MKYVIICQDVNKIFNETRGHSPNITIYHHLFYSPNDRIPMYKYNLRRFRFDTIKNQHKLNLLTGGEILIFYIEVCTRFFELIIMDEQTKI